MQSIARRQLLELALQVGGQPPFGSNEKIRRIPKPKACDGRNISITHFPLISELIFFQSPRR
jgi:hypothetical protein